MLAPYHKAANFVLPSIFATERRSGFYVGRRGVLAVSQDHCASDPRSGYLISRCTSDTNVTAL